MNKAPLGLVTKEGYHVLPVQTLAQTIAFWPSIWTILAEVIDKVIAAIDPAILPAWLRGWWPIIVLIVGILFKHTSTKSVSAEIVQESPAPIVPAVVTPSVEPGKTPVVEEVAK